jgi:hypothetical protein
VQASKSRDNNGQKVTTMKISKKIFLITVSLALLVFTFESCKSDVIEQPSPLGPSSASVILSMNASPNVIFATRMDRQTVEITASLRMYDGAALSGRTVFFEIVNSAGNELDLGFFDQNLSVQNVVTGGDGVAKTIYHGPLRREVDHDRHVYIRATVAWEGSQFINNKATIWVIRDPD